MRIDLLGEAYVLDYVIFHVNNLFYTTKSNNNYCYNLKIVLTIRKNSKLYYNNLLTTDSIVLR